MTTASMNYVRHTVCNAIRELGEMLDQLEHVEELTRLPSADPKADATAKQEAYISATEAALTAHMHAASLADLCAAFTAVAAKKEAA